MPADASDAQLSKYELIRQLGSGGMGVVYLARDTVLNRDVAIKFVSPDRLTDPGAEQRLVREARAAAALDHPAICPVYAVHLGPNTRTCIVMQYVEGETLAMRLARGSLNAREAITLSIEVAEALAVAHARGVIHRDLKPQNIMVTPLGRAKLLDFGIAQVQPIPADAFTRTTTMAVAPGKILGTPAYMSPEQVLLKPLDGRSDLFSLGAVLYEMLTGRSPFKAPTDLETWERVVNYPPDPPSGVKPALGTLYDSLCAQLLAKDPADRFQSADAFIGAARPLAVESVPPAHRLRSFAYVAAIVAAATVTAALAGWRVMRPRPWPDPPAQARQWYDQGTEHLRNGAYYSAQKALQEAIRAHPAYPQALTRLAESQTELDDEREAQAAMVSISNLVSDPSVLPPDDATRLVAVRALVMRDMPRAVAGYKTIAERNAGDRGAWLDLARVSMAAGLRADARRAAERAVQIDRDYAAGHLRLGTIAAVAALRDEALREFAEAERLYVAGSNVEGHTETLLARARFLNGIGELPAAGESLDRASALAAQTGNRSQQIGADLIRGSVVASTGGFGEARRIVQGAVDLALKNDLDTVAADGLIELGTTLMRLRDYPSARVELQSAIDLARRHGANGIAARGTLQLSSLFLSNGQPKDALALVGGISDFLHRAQYRRFELVARSIEARAREDLGEFAEAHRLAREVLLVAESLQDDSEVALALEALAGQSVAAGSLPEALAFRVRLEDIHRRQKDTAALAFDLTNRAELLVRLGQFEAGEKPLREIDAGASAGVEAFSARGRRALLVRAMAAMEQLNFSSAEAFCRQVVIASAGLKSPDTTQWLAQVLLAGAQARLGRAPDSVAALPSATSGAVTFRREFHYWRGVALLARGDAAGALSELDTLLASGGGAVAASSEFEWRAAALAAAAARRRGDTQRADALAARARDALLLVRGAWKNDIGAYEQRPDLIERKREAGLYQF